MWLTPFNIFAIKLKFLILHPYFKTSFIFFFTVVRFFFPQRLQPLPLGLQNDPPLSDSGSGAPDPGAFIQCVDGREPIIQELWCQGIDRICCEVHPTSHINIPAGNIG